MLDWFPRADLEKHDAEYQKFRAVITDIVPSGFSIFGGVLKGKIWVLNIDKAR
jgi:hypothetical protein